MIFPFYLLVLLLLPMKTTKNPMHILKHSFKMQINHYIKRQLILLQQKRVKNSYHRNTIKYKIHFVHHGVILFFHLYNKKTIMMMKRTQIQITIMDHHHRYVNQKFKQMKFLILTNNCIMEEILLVILVTVTVLLITIRMKV